MSTILEILNQIAATTKRGEKEAILKAHRDDETLKRVCKMAYDKQILFYTQFTPDKSPGGSETLDWALSHLLDTICRRALTGNAALGFIQVTFDEISPDDQEVLARVINKDLRAGFSASTINKVWPGLIPEPKFMLAQTDDKKIEYPAISQVKMDGTRAMLLWDGFHATFVTRNGNTIETRGRFEHFAEVWLKPGVQLDGEILAMDSNGNIMARQDSNGIVNKAVRGTITQEEADSLVFVAWDYINPETPNTPYHVRLDTLEALLNKAVPLNIRVVESRWVDDKDAALDHYRECRARGDEGTILKNAMAPWQGKRTYDLAKFKAEYEGEFKVVGYELGTGKNEGRVGALIVESADGLVRTNVGIFKDFPDSIRDDWLSDMPNIVTIRYNERILEDGKEVESLFLPRVIGVRLDKDTANTRDELIAQEEAAYQ